MRYYKKMKFTKNELADLTEQMDGYIWCAVDARRGIISAGDDFIPDMRDDLIERRSKAEDIYGCGIDLKTGRIDYVKSVNRRNPKVRRHGEVSLASKQRIENLVRYFFDGIAPYVAERNRPRYSRKPIDAQFVS